MCVAFMCVNVMQCFSTSLTNPMHAFAGGAGGLQIHLESRPDPSPFPQMSKSTIFQGSIEISPDDGMRITLRLS